MPMRRPVKAREISSRATTVLLRFGFGAICLLSAALAASADTVRPGDETAVTGAVSRARGSAPAVQSPPQAPKPDPRKLAEWHKQAIELLKTKEYAKAIEKYEEILKVTPDNSEALYNLACAHALRGEKARALERLRKSVESGFVSFIHITRDPDLDSLREAAAYKDIFARKEEYLRQASERAVKQIAEYLARQKIDAKAYKAVYDDERRFVYLHAKSDEEFALVRAGMQNFAECLWRDLFDHRPEQPLYIVLLLAQDCPKIMPQGVGGFFQQEANTLFCAERPASKLLQASVVTHEFTHGLHWADQVAREQEHPIWLKEGLATLFESSRREDGKLTPVHSYRLLVVQRAIKLGQLIPWETLVKLDNARFVGNANLCYAQARYMLFYLREKGLLKTFYDEYVKASSYANDKSALEAFEVVFGKPAARVDRDWKEWVLKQQIPAVPFLGVVAEENEQRLIVKSVASGSAAAIAGLRKGDAIVTLEGTSIQTRDDLMEAVGHQSVGDEIEIRLERHGTPLAVTAKLVERPEVSARMLGQSKSTVAESPDVGIAVGESDGEIRVREVEKDSPAAKAGIEPRWQIRKFGQTNIQTVRDYLSAAKKVKPGQTVELTVRKPDGTDATLKLEIGAVRSGHNE